ncbi:hypothetical protein [Steroidobacter sp.]|uniref:hypothetical protein n=1 Tax=Steroidobacter sp. TaxID=1978227 RepID=UPI002EDA757C
MSLENAPAYAREYNRGRTQGGSNTVSAPSLKRQAHELIDNLPESATWEDVAYEVELRASIERGLADADAGRLIPIEDLKKEFGIDE